MTSLDEVRLNGEVKTMQGMNGKSACWRVPDTSNRNLTV